MSTTVSTTTEQSIKHALAALAAKAGTAQGGLDPEPAPEINGLLLQLPTNPATYLVLNGFRCLVPDPQTMQNLFNNNPTITPDINIGLVAEGNPLTSGAVLVVANGDPTVYLVTNGVKMGIPSPGVFNDYQFNWGKIQTIPLAVLNCIPTGPIVQGPTS